MTELNAKLESFIKTMSEGEEYSRRGFELLTKRSNPESYFDALAKAGFFDPSLNPLPVPSTEPGFVRIPFWTALNYLEAVARRSGELNDAELANKIMAVVRAVSQYRDPSGEIRDNHYTYWKFAEILGLVPTSAIFLEDVNLVSGWLRSKFDRGMVGRVLGTKVMGRLLMSADLHDIEKACVLLEHLTAFEWLEEKRRGRDVATVVEHFWLKEIIKQNVKLLGVRAGRRAANVFAGRLHAMFSDERRPYGSTMWRPAIEDSSQNSDFRGAENCFVEGLRDVLLAWIDTTPNDAIPYVRDALDNGSEIIRRIALHCVTERFGILRPTFEPFIQPTLFTSAYRHEMYRLLSEGFVLLSAEGKTAVVNSIRGIPPPEKGDQREVRLKRTQREWLSAIKDQGYEPAASWLNTLSSDKSLGPTSDHPEFLSYHESRWGPGPTPFGTDSLVAFAADGSIVEHLNEFEETDSWKGPTLGGLVSALEAAVSEYPDQFLPLLSAFHSAKIQFQYAVLNGFKNLFNVSSNQTKKLDWNVVWPKLLTFFSECIADNRFWEEPTAENIDLIPNRNWIISLIADFIETGTKDDETAYAAELLPQSLNIIRTLLARVEPDKDVSLTNPMTRALNTVKGRLVGALFNYSLRSCRLATQESGNTSKAWAQVQDLFDSEIAKCRNSNFEFSTLAASYIANLDYMNRDWLTANIKGLFPEEFPSNFKCAIGGLAYAKPTKHIYKLLAASGVLARAFSEKIEDSYSHEKIVEWIALAYLWGDESISSPMFVRLFETSSSDDLETVVSFFWSVRGEKLSDDQIEKIFEFWSKCITWGREQQVVPKMLFSRLAQLSDYLKAIDGRGKELLLAIVPYVNTDFHGDHLIGELSRLIDTNPEAVAQILERMLETYTPDFDLDDKLKNLIQKLSEVGFRAEAIRFAEKLRSSLPGMVDLYKMLVGAR